MPTRPSSGGSCRTSSRTRFDTDRHPFTLTATLGEADGELQLVVEDAGEGVPEDVRARVFEEFSRSARSAGMPGSGLGLAIARSYAHAHGGELLLDQNGTRRRAISPRASHRLDSRHGRHARRTALRPTGRRRRRRGHRGDPLAARRPRSDLVRRRLSGSLDVPARARGVAARRVRGERRDERVPVRADARPRRAARRVRPPRGHAGTQAGRRRAPDRERRDRSARARLEDVPRPGRRRRDRSADVPRRDHGLPRLRRRARRRPDGRARARRSTSSSGGSPTVCARSCSTRSPTTRTRRA